MGQRIALPDPDTTEQAAMSFKDIEAKREYDRRWKQANRDKVSEQNRRHYEANKDRLNKRRSEQTEEQQAARRAAVNRYYQRNKERIKEQQSQRSRDAAGTVKRKAQRRVSNRVHRDRAWPHAWVFLCSDCDSRAQDYHHEDYSLWWSVEPLCKRCHGIRHRVS